VLYAVEAAMLAQALCGTAVGVLLGAGLDQNVRDDLSRGLYKWTGVKSRLGEYRDVDGLRRALEGDADAGARISSRSSTALVTVTLVSFSSGLAVGWLFSGRPGSRAEQLRARLAASMRLKHLLASGALYEAYAMGTADDISAMTWNLFSTATSRGCELVKTAQCSLETVNRAISSRCYSLCRQVALHVQPIVDWAAALLNEADEEVDSREHGTRPEPEVQKQSCQSPEQRPVDTPQCSEADLALLENFTAELLQHESKEEAHAVEAKLEAELEELREREAVSKRSSAFWGIGSAWKRDSRHAEAPVARSPDDLVTTQSAEYTEEEVFQVVPAEVSEEDLTSSLLMDYEVVSMPGNEGNMDGVVHM